MVRTKFPSLSESEKERQRIVRFLWQVYKLSTHGASGLMERAIRAVESNEMSSPAVVAKPYSRKGCK